MAPSRALGRLLLATLLVPVLLGSHARAQSAWVPVIEAGREAEIRALFLPFSLGEELAEGWRLSSLRAEATSILVRLEKPGEAEVRVTLRHPGTAPEAALRSASFVVELSGESAGAAVGALLAALRRNDSGGFWRREAVDPALREQLGPLRSLAPRATLAAWLGDGLLWAPALAFFLLLALARDLRGGCPWEPWAALGVGLVGLALRLLLSPRVSLEAWPYTRVAWLVQHIFEGPVFGLLSGWLGGIYRSDLGFGLHLLMASLTPVLVMGWARRALASPIAGLAAGVLAACLPLHLRFSHSDVALVETVALVAGASYALYLGLGTGPWRWRGPALLAALLVGATSFLPRPLDFLHGPLFAWMILSAPGARSRFGRGGLAFAFVGLAVWLALTRVLPAFASAAPGGAELWRSLGLVLIDPELNTLIHPGLTPPWLLALAVLGGVALARRRAWAQLGLLLAWLFGFLLAHASVIPFGVWLQARYHLHLVLPFVLLGAVGLEVLWRWRVWAGALALGAAALAPATHVGFVRDARFNDQDEYRLVEGLRERLPEGCTVLEFTGPSDQEHYGSRFQALGTLREGDFVRRRWRVVEVGAALPGRGAPVGADPVTPEARALLANPPDCLAVFEGVGCWTQKGHREPLLYAPACAALREAVGGRTPIVERQLESRCFDEAPGTAYCQPGRRISLRLWVL